MEHLWTPWRSTYLHEKDRAPGCIFCKAAEDPAQDRQNLVVYRATHCFIILNRYPYSSGHLMIVPYEHVGTLTEVDEASAAEMMQLARSSERIVESVYHPEGLNMGLNIGTAAGAGIAQHIHLHVLPRWSGDANFMTTVGHTRIIPEALETTYDKLSEAFSTR